MLTRRPTFSRSRKWSYKVAIAGILTLTIMLLGTSSAFAYHTEGAKWENQPGSGCCAYLNVQFSSAWYPGDKTATLNAMYAWNGSPANVYFTQASGALTTDDTYDSSVNWDGLTTYATHWWFGTYFSYAHVLVNYYYTQSYSSAKTQSVAAHELGHAIGLAHSSGCVLMVGDTYTRWTVCGINTPRTDDVNGVNSLY